MVISVSHCIGGAAPVPASSKLMATILIAVGLGATLAAGREPHSRRLFFFFRLRPRAGASSRPGGGSGALHVPSSTWQQPSIAELVAGARGPRGLRGERWGLTSNRVKPRQTRAKLSWEIDLLVDLLFPLGRGEWLGAQIKVDR